MSPWERGQQVISRSFEIQEYVGRSAIRFAWPYHTLMCPASYLSTTHACYLCFVRQRDCCPPASGAAVGAEWISI